MKKIKISLVLGLIFSVLFSNSDIMSEKIESHAMFFPQSVISFEQEENDNTYCTDKLTIIDSTENDIQIDFFITDFFEKLFCQ